MELIERFGLKERIIISSFNHLSALSCKNFMPDIKKPVLSWKMAVSQMQAITAKRFGF